MTDAIFNPQSITLGDILLEVMENMSRNEVQKSFFVNFEYYWESLSLLNI